MSRIALIHGFATGVGYSVFRPAYGSDAGFKAFHEDVTSGEASVFRWGIRENTPFFQSLNPFYSWNVYLREREIMKNPKTIRDLEVFLSRERPEVIVCHSMGCSLLIRYLKQKRLPDSARVVVFNQSDAPASKTTFSQDAELDLHSGKLSILNTFCPWDPSLWISVILNGHIKSGLVGLQHPLVKNQLVALWRPINLHTAAIRSPGFRRMVQRVSVLSI